MDVSERKESMALQDRDVCQTEQFTRKLQTLASWRIEPTRIHFIADKNTFEWGSAVVCQAHILATRATGSSSEGNASTLDPMGVPQSVAVKKLKVNEEKEPSRALRLALREASFLAELTHSNIIELKGFVEDIALGQFWLILPWATHGNLRDFIASAEWEVPERIWLIYGVVQAVEYIHTRDPPLVHGDLKSINFLVNSEFQAVLTDFGSAHRLTRNCADHEPKKVSNDPKEIDHILQAESHDATHTITLTGAGFTLRWAAPEVLSEDEGGTESDMWSLGWVFYEVMTGGIPFEDVKKDFAVVLRIVEGKLPHIGTHTRMSLIQQLVSVINTCWKIDHTQRPTASSCRGLVAWMPMCPPTPRAAMNPTKLSIQQGWIYYNQSDYVKAWTAFNAALNHSSAGMTEDEKADALWGLAQTRSRESRFSEAADLFHQYNKLCEKLGTKRGLADGLKGLAYAHLIQGNYPEVVSLASRAAQIADDTNSCRWDGKAGCLWLLATVHMRQGGYAEACALYTECARLRGEATDRFGQANAVRGLGDVHRLQTQYNEALALYSECLQVYSDMGSRSGKADALWCLGELHRSRTEYAQAIEILTESVKVYREIGDRGRAAFALRALGHVHRDQNHDNDAIAHYNEAIELFKQVGLDKEVSNTTEFSNRLIYSVGSKTDCEML